LFFRYAEETRSSTDLTFDSGNVGIVRNPSAIREEFALRASVYIHDSDARVCDMTCALLRNKYDRVLGPSSSCVTRYACDVS